MSTRSALDSWLHQSNQDELNRGMQHVANDFDVDVVVSASAIFVTNEYLLKFMVRERRGEDHLMPLNWRLKQFALRILQIFQSANNLRVGLNDVSSISYYTSIDAHEVTIDALMKKVEYSTFMNTPTGPIRQGVFQLRVLELGGMRCG